MPTLELDLSDRSLEFFYSDSGPPGSKIYTTLVVVHGHSFHSGAFQRILPLAASKGIRLICLNRRDYAGTTLYSPAELEVLSTGDERERAGFLEARGIEMAYFIDRLIDKLALPEPTANGNSGGVAIMGWSLGNLFTIAAVAAMTSLPSSVKDRLQLYLRRSIVFDCPSVALGIHGPPKQYLPLFDESIPQADRGTAFAHWVTSYFAHGDPSKRDIDSLEYKTPDPSRKGVVSGLSQKDLDSILDFTPAWRSELFLLTRFETVLFRQTCKALFDPALHELWPGLRTWLLYSDSSPWAIMHAAWEVENMANANETQEVRFFVIEDAHHMVFWNEPERALDAFEYCLQN